MLKYDGKEPGGHNGLNYFFVWPKVVEGVTDETNDVLIRPQEMLHYTLDIANCKGQERKQELFFYTVRYGMGTEP